MKKACNNMINDYPAHSMPIELRICADSRKDDCPYHIPIAIDNKYIGFRQCFCGYAMRKEK
jgi:hypothetical protein